MCYFDLKGGEMKVFGKEIKLVIFDLDGTILDLQSSFATNISIAASKMGVTIEPFLTWLNEVNEGKAALHAGFREGVRELWPGLSDDFYSKFENYFRIAEFENPYLEIPGAFGTIKWLRFQSIKTAICTSIPYEVLLNRFSKSGLPKDDFDVLSYCGNGYQTKPSGEALEAIFSVLPELRQSCIYIGDTKTDFETAQNAEVEFLAVLSGGVRREVFKSVGLDDSHIIPNITHLRSKIAQTETPS